VTADFVMGVGHNPGAFDGTHWQRRQMVKMMVQSLNQAQKEGTMTLWQYFDNFAEVIVAGIPW
jgi:hypothetical protein